MKKQRSTKLSGIILCLSVILILSCVVGSAVFASNEDGVPCTVDGCEGAYVNGICSADGSHYQEATPNDDGVYEIANAGNLYWFAAKVNDGDSQANAKLTADITVNESVLTDGQLPDDTDTSALKQWTPIGNNTTAYTVYKGTFDGQDHTISGLYYSGSDDYAYAGLFGCIKDGATIKNVGVIDSCFQVSGNSAVYLGGIVGRASADAATITISDCSSAARLVVTGKTAYVGGVAGSVYSGNGTAVTIQNCSNTGKSSTTADRDRDYGSLYCGGVAGYVSLDGDVTIQNCSNTGDMTATTASDSKYSYAYCGGAVGYVRSSQGSAMIQNCSNTGELTATDESGYAYSGGVSGYVYTNRGTVTIQNCFSTGAQNATYSGGVLGYASANGENGGTVLSNCYYTVEDPCGATYTDGDGAEVTLDGVNKKTAAQFASGEVTYLLNGSTSEGTLVWKQTLSGEGKQDLPAFTGDTVYYGYQNCADSATPIYANTVLSAQKPAHGTSGYTYVRYDDMTHQKQCKACGQAVEEKEDCTVDTDGFCTVCDRYQKPEGEGTAENPYKIAKAGNLYWFAAQCNGDDTSVRGAYVQVTADIIVNANVLKADGELNGDGSNFRVWTPIKSFHGTFDGNGKKISGLYFNDPTADTVGLFGEVSDDQQLDNSTGIWSVVPAYVKNVILTDSYFYGNNTVGGIAGRNSAHIVGCVSSATVVGKGNRVGGIAGYNGSRTMPGSDSDYIGRIEKCVNTGKVYGYRSVGGIAGGNQYQVVDCYNTGSVSENNPDGKATTADLGGVVGYNTSNGSIANCYNIGTATVDDELAISGGVVGSNDGTLTNCFYLTGCATDSSGRAQNGVGGSAYNSTIPADVAGQTTAVTNTQLTSGEVTYLLNGSTSDESVVWKQTLGTDELPNFTSTQIVYTYMNCVNITFYTNDSAKESGSHGYNSNGFCTACGGYEEPTLSDGYYLIDNAGKLYWFAAEVNGGNNTINAKLTADITVNSGTFAADGTYTPGEGEAAGTTPRAWTPIGNSDKRYTGTFDGQGHTISGLYYNDTNTDSEYIGLFGSVETNGTVQNVTVKGTYFKGDLYVGGIVGYNKGTVTNCVNSGTVIGTTDVGGIVGFNVDGTLTGCTNSGSVSGTNSVGGVVGENNAGTITSCHNSGAINGKKYVGGIVGYNSGGTIAGTVAGTADQYTTNSGAISGKEYVGGIVGYNENTTSGAIGTIRYCENSAGGTVTGTGDDTVQFTGGIVGYNDGGKVENCQNKAAVTGDAYVGGVVGSNGGSGEVSHCKNSGAVSGSGNDVGGIAGQNGGTVAYCENSAKVMSTGDMTQAVGGIVGLNSDNGEVSNCKNSGDVSGFANIGGIIGYMSGNGKVTLCENSGAISGWAGVGGIMGTSYNYNITLSDCINSGNVTGVTYIYEGAPYQSQCIGGIVGGDCDVLRCINVGTVTGGQNVGGIVGEKDYGTVENSYYLSATETADGGKTAAQFASGEVAWLLNGSTSEGTLVWKQTLDGNSYPGFTGGTVYKLTNTGCSGAPAKYSNDANEVYAPAHGTSGYTYDYFVDMSHQKRCKACRQTVGEKENCTFGDDGFCTVCDLYQTPKGKGTAEDPYQIANAGNLYWFAACTNVPGYEGKCAVLTADITVNPGTFAADGTYTAVGGETPRQWTPIGNDGHAYTGTFNGQNHTISGLYYNSGSDSYVGLFGYIGGGATIQNVAVTNSYFQTSNSWISLGGIVGNAEVEKGATITISGCSSAAHLVATGDMAYVGGVLGRVVSNSAASVTIQNCANTGKITATSASNIVYCGGVVGYVSASQGSVTIQNCANTGKITATSDSGAVYCGGVAGSVITSEGSVTLQNCFSTGNLSAKAANRAAYCGGVAGYVGAVEGAVTIRNCFSTGDLSATSNNTNDSYCGGVAGYAYVSTTAGDKIAEVIISNCYYTADDPCGAAETVGDGALMRLDGANKKTAAQFASGEVAWLLNGSTSEGTLVWKQTLGTDNTPNFTSTQIVYTYTNCVNATFYTNDSAKEPGSHDYNSNGFCTACGGYEEPTLIDGYYQIANAGNLCWFAAKVNSGETNICGKLTADIDATGVAYIGIGQSESLAYAGTFDGNGKKLTIKLSSDLEYLAVFPYISNATIKNLIVDGEVNASNHFAGGIVGRALGEHNSLQKCLSLVTINSTFDGDGTHGGLISIVASGTMTIDNCGFAGRLIGPNTTSCGGFIGWTDKTAKVNISNSYVAAYFELEGNIGNTFGRNPNYILITNCYYLNALSDASVATQMSAESFASGEVTWLLNGGKADGVWKQTLNGTNLPGFTGDVVYSGYEQCKETRLYTNDSAKAAQLVDTPHNYVNGICTVGGCYQAPTLTDGYYRIANAGNLYWFANFVNQGGDNLKANAKLTADIDLEKRAWTPIGGENDQYTGTFDGQNHTISGLYVTIRNYAGMFGHVGVGGNVTNLTVSDALINGDIYVGGIAGYNKGTVSNCRFSGAVSAIGNVSGGVVGKNEGTVKDCCNTGTVTGDGNDVGGVVGSNEGKVTDCYNTGNITGLGHNVGGVVGNNGGNFSITGCYNTGNVTGGYNFVGGVVGYDSQWYKEKATIENCYNTGTVTGSGEYVGGIIGAACKADDTGALEIKNCYNTGTVIGKSAVGGVIGYNEGVVTNCFYLTGCAMDGDGKVQYGIGAATAGENLADIKGQTEGMTASDFTSGKVTYLLNGDQTTIVWKQTLTGENADALPGFTSESIVYKLTKTGCPAAADRFSNTDGETFEGEHAYKNGICACGDYEEPTLNDGVYEIDNAGKLYWFAAQVNGGEYNACAKLTADIDLENRAWTAIGTVANPYTGTFDGGNFTISGFSMTVTSSNQGFFGAVSGGKVKNFTIKGEINITATIDVSDVSNIKSISNVGAVVGSATNGAVIENVTSCVNITDSHTPITYTDANGNEQSIRVSGIGGIAGNLDGSTISHCLYDGTIKSVCGSSIAGIVGNAANSSTVDHCTNKGTITAENNSAHIGGIAGDAQTGATISYCVNYGDITSSGIDCIGGIVAYANRDVKIDNCGNLGTVTCTADGHGFIGGILGYINNAAFKGISNCFNYGSIVTNEGMTNHAGAILGYNKVSGNVYTNNYYLDTSFTKASSDNAINNTYSATAEQFKSGEIAYKLNGGKSDGAWKQTIGSAAPDFTSDSKVYGGYKKCDETMSYGNEPPVDTEASEFRTSPHVFWNADGFCADCGKAFQPATQDNDGYYLIGNIGQLFWFAEQVNAGNTAINAKLTADIDLAGYVWTPIGLYSDSGEGKNAYMGTFDGDHHVIMNLKVELNNTFEAGLFSRVATGGVIKNLGVINASVTQNGTGSDGNGIRAGIIAGEIYRATVQNVYTAGTLSVTTTHDQWGGLAGECNGSNLINCFTTMGRLTDGREGSQPASVTNCYYMADAADSTSAGEHKTKTEFENGTVAWLLNGGSSEDPVWKQTLGASGNAYPDFASTDVVYGSLDCGKNLYYDNEQHESGKKHTALGANGLCACGKTYEPCEGEGTATDPYLIKNAGNLYWFAAKVNGGAASIHGKLTADFTVNSGVLRDNGDLSDNWESFFVWTPIGNERNPYTGTFDGNNKSISGLFIDNDDQNIGLFGYVGEGGMVKNVAIKDSYISGSRYVGGVVGDNDGTIMNCSFAGSLYGSSCVGGIASYNTGTIMNCYHTGEVNGMYEFEGVSGYNIGGVVGFNPGGDIMNCYHTGGDIDGDVYVGGVVGSSSGGTIKNCYNTGWVNGSTCVGGVVGSIDYACTVSNCFCLEGCTVSNQAIGAEARSTVTNVGSKFSDEFTSGEITWLFNGGKADGVWKQTLNGTNFPGFTGDVVYSGYEQCKEQRLYTNDKDLKLLGAPHTYDTNGLCDKQCGAYEPCRGEGTATDPYLIKNIGNLYWFAEQVNGGRTDIHGKLTTDITVNPGTFAKDGTYTAANGETLRAWTPIGSDVNRYTGTFDGSKYDENDEKVIGNYTISGLYYNGSDDYVGLFGYVGEGGTVKNVTVKDAYIIGGSSVGGVAGHNDGTITNCANTGAITGSDNSVGGVAGHNDGTITNCYNTGNITGSGNSVGGVVGGNNGTITNCYNTGNITGSGSEVGGVAGYNDGTITNCYNTGAVTGADCVGGVVGYNYGGSVTNCYNTGNITGTDLQTGGVVGYNYGGSVTNCHNTGEVNGTDRVGGVAGESNGEITNCYNTGKVTGTGESIGGVVGFNSGPITNCYNTGEVNGASSIGGVVGESSGPVTNCYNTGEVNGTGDHVGGVFGFNFGEITNCYYLSGITAGRDRGTVTNVEPMTAADFKSGKVTWLLNGKRSEGTDEDPLVWKQTLNGENLPGFSGEIVYGGYVGCDEKGKFSNKAADVKGTEPEVSDHLYDNGFCTWCDAYEIPALNGNGTEDPSDDYYEIANAGNLYWFAEQVNGGRTDINGRLTAYILVNKNVLKKDGSLRSGTFRAWTPIGSASNKYIGTFEGMGTYVISGLYVNDTTKDYVGLFGYVGEGGYVLGVMVTDSYFKGNDYVGSVAGYNAGTITNASNTGTVIGSENVGGLVGANLGTIWDGDNHGTVSGLKNVGGVAGQNYGEVATCYSNGTVTGSGNSVGGVVGGNNGTITNCYNIGAVDGNSFVGGVVGRNYDEVTYCYNVGKVTGSGNSVGSVVGSNSGTIMNCYYLTGCAKDGNATVQYGIGNATQGSTTADAAGATTGKTAAQFASGEVAYLLNDSMSDENCLWGQIISVDEYPSLYISVVYPYTDCQGHTGRYGNDQPQDGDHYCDANGFCIAEKPDGTACGAYQPCVEVGGVYIIKNLGNLYWFADKVRSGETDINGRLEADIVVNPGTFDENGNYTAAGSETLCTWTPLGTADDPYIGTFYGNGHIISGLYFKDDDMDNVGLFGYVGENGEVQAVTVSNAYFRGKNNVGGVAGTNAGVVVDCTNEAITYGVTYVGGVIGNDLGYSAGNIHAGTIVGSDQMTGSFIGAQVALGKDLSIVYYAKFNNVSGDIAPYVVFFKNGETFTVEGVKMADGTYKFTFEHLAPQTMGDHIKAELYVGEQLMTVKLHYSVKENLLNLAAKNADNSELLTLIYNTLNYGAAAQEYVDYDAGDLVNDGYEDKVTEYQNTTGAGQFELSASTGTARFTHATVEFDNVNRIIVLVRGAATVKIDGEDAATITEEGICRTDGISVTDFDKVYTFELYENGVLVQTLKYSVNAYTARVKTDLNNALFNYGMAAKAYVASLPD